MLGQTQYDALGRMAVIWSIATDNKRECVDVFDVADVFETDETQSVSALINSKLGTPCDCGRDDCIRVRGGERLGANGWCNKKAETARENGAKGGRPKKKSGQSPAKTQSDTKKKTHSVSFAKPSSEQEQEREQEQENEPEPEKERGGSGGRFDFESVYQAYPRKQGKAKGLKAAKAKIRTREDFDRFQVAVETMSTAWQGHETRFCPHFSTFVNQERWRDEVLPIPSDPDPLRPNPDDVKPRDLDVMIAQLEAQGQ